MRTSAMLTVLFSAWTTLSIAWIVVQPQYLTLTYFGMICTTFVIFVCALVTMVCTSFRHRG